MYRTDIKTADNYRYPKELIRPEPGHDDHDDIEESVDPQHYNTCTVKAAQKAIVNVPFSLKPFAVAGPANTLCLEEPVIKDVRCSCHGTSNQVCYVTISQEICVEVPISFGAKVSVGKYWVECVEPCDNCQCE